MKDKNLFLLEQLINRIHEALAAKQNTTLRFEVEIKNGEIKSITWKTKFSINFI